MASTDKVFGTIGALNTLIENFPMSILDLFKGKTYTSVFEFIMDVLYACGVNTNDIISFLVNEIFSIETNIEGGVEELKEKIGEANFINIQESPFLNSLEYGLKGILMTLLSSLYGCSAIPILPNKVMDFPDNKTFSGNVNTTLWENFIYPATFDIPVKLIDPMGMLEITPTSPEGRSYYEVRGSDVLYKKIKNNKQKVLKNKINTNIKNSIYITNEFSEDKIILHFNSINELPEDIIITMGYFSKNNGDLLVWNDTIKLGETKTRNGFILSNNNELNTSSIRWIKINGESHGANINGNIHCFLSEDLSKDTIEKYPFFANVKWEKETSNLILGETQNENEYSYEIVSGGSKEFKQAVRKATIIDNPSERDPEYIKVYKGEDPNLLYQTFDMNAFIWYAIVKSSRSSQININHTMWDSRLLANKKGINRSVKEWNDWYESKKINSSEFLYDNKNIKKDSSLYPILQLKKSPINTYSLDVSFPAQRYFKTAYREKILNEENVSKIKGPTLTFNSSIYRFNWEYLESIQILRPKLLLTGFVDYLLGFTLDTVNNINIDFTKKVIEKKLSTAVTKIIEADDMEIEDCYTSFSNDEFNEMMEETLLSRYNATYYGGENNKVKTHDLNYYMSLIDSFNSSTSREESITTVTKLIDEVMATPSVGEDTIEYGINIGLDKNILKKLLWAITMPIVQSLFTPQVMLLLVINMNLTGVVKIDESLNNDMGKIMNLLINKIMGLLKSIIKYIKDMIVELLLKLLMSKLMPLLAKYMGALAKERLEYWLTLLAAAIACLPTIPLFNIKRTKTGGIDEVNYADIISTGQTETPESKSPC